jgi:protein-L-isoaspartate(D-aspartate) O-methyltransferase
MKQAVFPLLIFLFSSTQVVADRGSDSDGYVRIRHEMVAHQIQDRGILVTPVLEAMKSVPRHRFVPKNLIPRAYGDYPLPIGEGQTISQPYVVALMTACLQLTSRDRVLEIGTGSGYQAAVLSLVAKEVYSIEIKEKLHRRATQLLKALKFENVQTRHGDGYFGWKEKAPFDGIMITAAVNHIPNPLLEQLKDQGRLILPLGNPFSYQNLVLVTKTGNDYTVKQITGVLFVPMTGYSLERKE